MDHGWDARVYDFYSKPDLIDDYLQLVAVRPPTAIGISLHGASSLEPGMRLAQTLRSSLGSTPLLFGGNLVEVSPEIVVPYLPERSAVIRRPTWDLISSAIRDLGRPSTDVLTRQGSLDVVWWQTAVESLHPSLGVYLAETDFEYHLETQVGCPYRCFHCGTGRPGLYGKVYLRPLDAISEELDAILSACQRNAAPPPLWITDETFLADREHAIRVCQLFLSRGEVWRWRAQTRADTVQSDLLSLMRDAGCNRIALGVEIPTDSGLRLLNKRELMDSVSAAFASCRVAGIQAEAILVLGSPGDRTEARVIIDTLNALGAASVQGYIYHPVPGSPWWRKHGPQTQTGDAGDPSRWSRLDFHSPPVIASELDSDVVIGHFLLLQVWQAGAAAGPQEARAELSRSSDVKQHRCRSGHGEFSCKQLASAGVYDVLKFARPGRVLYVARGPSTCAVYAPPDERSHNIHQYLSMSNERVVSGVGDTECPWCAKDAVAS